MKFARTILVTTALAAAVAVSSCSSLPSFGSSRAAEREAEDKAGRLAQFAKNDDFFGAPAALFCFVDRRMGPPQWSDLGMYLQTFMLLAQEAGLDTCPQEYWTVRHGAVQEFVGAPEEEMLFCGVAVGRADPDAPINSLESERMPLEDWATFL